MSKQLIIFDMDGTLINSGNIIANTINYVRTNCGLKAMDKQILLQNINNPNINSAKFFYNIEHFTPKHSQLFEEYYYKHHLEEIVLYKGIKHLLKTLSHNHLLTIATNANTKFAISMTKHLDIYKYFDYIIGADKVQYPKPNPDMILKIIDKYKYNLKNIILIGDSKKDMLAAKKADINFILVNWGFSKFDSTQPNIVKSIEELKDIINKNSL